jgi:hypothetical protein
MLNRNSEVLGLEPTRIPPVSGLKRMDPARADGQQHPGFRVIPLGRNGETNAQYRERMQRQIGSLPKSDGTEPITFPIKHPVKPLPRRLKP